MKKRIWVLIVLGLILLVGIIKVIAESGDPADPHPKMGNPKSRGKFGRKMM